MRQTCNGDACCASPVPTPPCHGYHAPRRQDSNIIYTAAIGVRNFSFAHTICKSKAIRYWNNAVVHIYTVVTRVKGASGDQNVHPPSHCLVLSSSSSFRISCDSADDRGDRAPALCAARTLGQHPPRVSPSLDRDRNGGAPLRVWDLTLRTARHAPLPRLKGEQLLGCGFSMDLRERGREWRKGCG